jgi:hypothetical protein
MGGKSAPAPDYAPLGNASKEAAQIMGGLGREQLAFARQQYGEISPYLRDIATQQQAAQNQQMRQAQDYYDYQTSTFRPVERGLVQQAQEFNTEDYRNQLASKAAADAGRAFGQTQAATQRAMGSMGVNPNSGRFAGLQNQNAVALAAQKAGAMTGTRQQAEQMGFARQLDVTGLGRGLSGASSAAYQGATGAGSAAGNSYMGAGNQFMGGMTAAGNTMGQGFNIQNQGLSSILGSQTSVYNQAQNAQGELIGSVLGAGGTLGAAYMSDRRVKENIEVVGVDSKTKLPLYDFNYIGDPSRRWRGVMADDVEKRFPDAVINTANGTKMVNYGALGIEMVEV